MTPRERTATRMMLGIATIATLGYGWVLPSFSYDPTQSTGTGTVQGKDGSMTTQRGGNTGPTTGRNEHSGSATGAVRDPKQSEPEKDKDRTSHQLGSDSGHEANKGDSRGKEQPGGRTGK
ncbi:MAG: hypothetical protein ACXWWE_01380 [Nitrospira sp.]